MWTSESHARYDRGKLRYPHLSSQFRKYRCNAVSADKGPSGDIGPLKRIATELQREDALLIVLRKPCSGPFAGRL